MPGAALFGSAAAVAAQALRRAELVRLRSCAERPCGSAQWPRDPHPGHLATHNLGHLATHTRGHAEEAAIADIDTRADPDGTGSLTVILSGRRSELPAAAYQYRQGRELASLMADFDTVGGLPA
jgi:hypothetical protein